MPWFRKLGWQTIEAEDGRQAFTIAERERPALVILCHGGNDILRKRPLDAVKSNLLAMIELARGAGAEVVLVECSFFRPADRERAARFGHLRGHEGEGEKERHHS